MTERYVPKARFAAGAYKAHVVIVDSETQSVVQEYRRGRSYSAVQTWISAIRRARHLNHPTLMS